MSYKLVQPPRGFDAGPWAVVYRCRNSSSRGIPVAAFFNTELAQAWIDEAKHRKNDKIVMHKLNINSTP